MANPLPETKSQTSSDDPFEKDLEVNRFEHENEKKTFDFVELNLGIGEKNGYSNGLLD